MSLPPLGTSKWNVILSPSKFDRHSLLFMVKSRLSRDNAVVASAALYLQKLNWKYHPLPTKQQTHQQNTTTALLLSAKVLESSYLAKQATQTLTTVRARFVGQLHAMGSVQSCERSMQNGLLAWLQTAVLKLQSLHLRDWTMFYQGNALPNQRVWPTSVQWSYLQSQCISPQDANTPRVATIQSLLFTQRSSKLSLDIGP